MTRTQPTDEENAAILDLFERSQLDSVEFHEYSARRLVENAQAEEKPDETEVSIACESFAGDDRFGVRLVLKLLPFKGEISVSVAGEYVITEGGAPDPHAVLGFGNEIAIMSLLPYAREAVSTLSTRVFGKPVLLPVIRRGDIGFDLDGE